MSGGRPGQRGAALIELLATLLIALFVILAAFSLHSQANALRADIQATVDIQDNTRLGLERVERDLRMIGLGVPTGPRVGTTTLWTPAIFYANATSLGFRAEIDGGRAEIICTPNGASATCPRNKLLLDTIGYYQRLACAPPDGSLGALKLVAVVDGESWEPASCASLNAASKTLTLSANLTNVTFTGGSSEAVTVEQVYLRFVPSSAPPYGRLLRYVRYDNVPSDTFPPVGVTWDTVATHLTGFTFAFADAADTALTGNPLSAANRAAVARVIVTVTGHAEIGPENLPRSYSARSEILVRNAS